MVPTPLRKMWSYFCSSDSSERGELLTLPTFKLDQFSLMLCSQSRPSNDGPSPGTT